MFNFKTGLSILSGADKISSSNQTNTSESNKTALYNQSSIPPSGGNNGGTKIVNLDWIGQVAEAIPSTAAVFNSEYQQNQVAIAQANADAARSIANSNNSNNGMSNRTITFLIVGVVIAVVLIGVLKNK